MRRVVSPLIKPSDSAYPLPRRLRYAIGISAERELRRIREGRMRNLKKIVNLTKVARSLCAKTGKLNFTHENDEK